MRDNLFYAFTGIGIMLVMFIGILIAGLLAVTFAFAVSNIEAFNCWLEHLSPGLEECIRRLVARGVL